MKSPRHLAALCIVAVLPLTACSPADLFGPRANGTIMELAKQASADQFGGNNEWNELRATHADQLQEEARRLCGTSEHGDVPTSCNVTYGDTDLPASGTAEDLVTRTATAADKVPAESRDLVIAQAIDAAAAEKLPIDGFKPPIEGLEPLNAAKELVSAEYAVEFGLDIASAYADEQLHSRINDLRLLHDARVATLHHTFPTAELPAREAGYEIPDGAPTNPAEATAFVDALENNLVEHWRAAAANADSPEWRELAILLAGHAQSAASQN
ncbi:DUF4439 domain-containing protein [Corynebacterium sp. MSK044]|uniref:DUF4439 domain-containing protein n=1 Tax=Corynebacterium sp. MSK044 TaxID=3050195 RepID=UPI00254F3063|nr:DUF4439 domain-containing protein [Corynebacterium sp. MSK044]MDK8797282.1 DUF4439 domain-containing protein [Corynebacterium sp. MSK044]